MNLGDQVMILIPISHKNMV